MKFAEARWARALGEAMCAQWHIDPNVCSKIVITWEPDQVPKAVVTLELNEGVVRELLHLVPILSETLDDDDEDWARGRGC